MDVGKKFATITAYDYTSSKIVNDIGFPVVLVEIAHLWLSMDIMTQPL